MSKNRRPNYIDRYFTARLWYSGYALPRHVIIEDLRSRGVPEQSMGSWLSERHETEVTAEQALWYDQQWIILQRVEQVQYEREITFAAAQAVVDDEMRADPAMIGAYCEVAYPAATAAA